MVVAAFQSHDSLAVDYVTAPPLALDIRCVSAYLYQANHLHPNLTDYTGRHLSTHWHGSLQSLRQQTTDRQSLRQQGSSSPVRWHGGLRDCMGGPLSNRWHSGPAGYLRLLAQSVGMVACGTAWADLLVPVGILGLRGKAYTTPGPVRWHGGLRDSIGRPVSTRWHSSLRGISGLNDSWPGPLAWWPVGPYLWAANLVPVGMGPAG